MSNDHKKDTQTSSLGGLKFPSARRRSSPYQGGSMKAGKGGVNSKVAAATKRRRCQIGEVTFWPLRAGPVYWVQEGESVLTRLMPPSSAQRVVYYRIKKAKDLSPLPGWMHPFWSTRSYLSTYRDSFNAATTRDGRWVMEEREGTRFSSLERGAISITLVEKRADVWALHECTADVHPRGGFPWPPEGDDLEVVKALAEVFFAQCFSDPFGVEEARQRNLKYGERSIWKRDQWLVPLYCMAWTYFETGGAQNEGKMTYPKGEPLRKPDPALPSIRVGMSWIESPTSPLERGGQTWQNYIRYSLDVYSLCAGCDRDNTYGLKEHPRLKLSCDSFRCKRCSELLIDEDEGLPMDEAYFAQTSSSELLLTSMEELECSSCSYVGQPLSTKTCSNPQCLGPRPTSVDEVITVMSRVGDGTWTFEVFDHTSMRGLCPDWNSLPAYTPTRAPARMIPVTVAGGYMPDYDPCSSGHFVTLSSPDQVKLLGSDLFDPTLEAAEDRRTDAV